MPAVRPSSIAFASASASSSEPTRVTVTYRTNSSWRADVVFHATPYHPGARPGEAMAGGQAGDDRRPDVVAREVGAVAAGGDRAVAPRLLDGGDIAVDGARVDHRAGEDVGLRGVADGDVLRARPQAVDELVVDRVDHDRARARAASASRGGRTGSSSRHPGPAKTVSVAGSGAGHAHGQEAGEMATRRRGPARGRRAVRASPAGAADRPPGPRGPGPPRPARRGGGGAAPG